MSTGQRILGSIGLGTATFFMFGVPLFFGRNQTPNKLFGRTLK